MARLLTAAPWLVLQLLLALQCHPIQCKPDIYGELLKWIQDHGGKADVEVKINDKGIRSLFTRKAAKKGDILATIPGSVIMNVGTEDGNFITPSLMLLREMRSNSSRFRPYLNTLPNCSDVINVCTFDQAFLPMLQSDFWEKFIQEWQGYLGEVLSGKVNEDLDYTVKEVFGKDNVTVDDLRCACALANTRYLTTLIRKRLILIPLYDMGNHRADCPHHITQYDAADEVHILAGEDVELGEELCHSYGMAMRDDFSLVHYGFLPEVEDPPRLLMVDHRDFKDELEWLPDLGDWEGSPKEMQEEKERLEEILEEVESFKDPHNLPMGANPLYDMLLELRRRRILALRHELDRIDDWLDAEGERRRRYERLLKKHQRGLGKGSKGAGQQELVGQAQAKAQETAEKQQQQQDVDAQQAQGAGGQQGEQPKDEL